MTFSDAFGLNPFFIRARCYRARGQKAFPNKYLQWGLPEILLFEKLSFLPSCNKRCIFAKRHCEHGLKVAKNRQIVKGHRCKIQSLPFPHPKPLQHLIAVVIDHLHGDPSGIGSVKRAAFR